MSDVALSGDEQSSVRHLVELGYEDPLVAAERASREAKALEAALSEANALAKAGEFDRAQSLAAELAETHPEASGPRRLLARLAFQRGHFDATLQALVWLEMHAFEHAEFALMRASIALRRRELAAAIDQAEYARHLQDPLPAADLILGEAHFRRGELAAARAAYERGRQASGENAAALAGLAAVCLRLGALDEAVDWSLQAIEKNPGLAMAHYRLGLALAGMDCRAEAIAALEMTARLAPHLAGSHRWLARLHDEAADPRSETHRNRGREIVAARRAARRHAPTSTAGA